MQGLCRGNAELDLELVTVLNLDMVGAETTEIDNIVPSGAYMKILQNSEDACDARSNITDTSYNVKDVHARCTGTHSCRLLG